MLHCIDRAGPMVQTECGSSVIHVRAMRFNCSQLRAILAQGDSVVNARLHVLSQIRLLAQWQIISKLLSNSVPDSALR